MARLTGIAAILGLFPLAARADVTQDELRRLSAAGVSEHVILEFIQMQGPVQRLSAEDLIALRKAGATDKVLAAALASARTPVATTTATASTSTPPPAALPEQTVVVPETTVVYDSYPSALYTPAYPPYSFTFGVPFGCARPRGHVCQPRTHGGFFSFNPRCATPHFFGLAHHR